MTTVFCVPSKGWAISARLFAFRVAWGCLRPLHFLGGRFAKNTYENSRVSGKRDSAEVWCAGSGRRDGDHARRGGYGCEELVWRGEQGRRGEGADPCGWARQGRRSEAGEDARRGGCGYEGDPGDA